MNALEVKELPRLGHRHQRVESWRGQALAALHDPPGAFVTTGVACADNAEFVALAEALGTIITKGTVLDGHPLETGGVYRVEPVNDGNGVCDDAGLLIFSTTAQAFEAHTDGYHNEAPPGVVLLLCVRPDNRPFGATHVSDGRSAAAALDPEQIALLRDRVFPTSSGATAVLSGPVDRLTVRFNMREIDRFAEHGRLDGAHHDAARAFARTLAQPAFCWLGHLDTGDCLVLDNRRAVHARSELSPGSRRLMKRVWVDGPSGVGGRT